MATLQHLNLNKRKRAKTDDKPFLSFFSSRFSFFLSFFSSKKEKKALNNVFFDLKREQRTSKDIKKKNKKKETNKERNTILCGDQPVSVERDHGLFAQAPDGSDNGGKPVGVTAADSAPAFRGAAWDCAVTGE